MSKVIDPMLHQLFEKNPDGIIMMNEDGVVHFANETACKLFNKPREELIGEAFGVPVVAGESVEIQIPGKDGKIKVAEMRVWEGEWAQAQSFIVFIKDITREKRLEEALNKKRKSLEYANSVLLNSNKKLDQYARLISHDLMNPLCIIRTSLEMLEKNISNVDPSNVKKYISFIRDSADSMMEKTSLLLKTSRKDGVSGAQLEQLEEF